MMIKRALLAVMLAAVGCGDNYHVDLPPEVVSQSARISVSMTEDGTVMIDASAVDPEGEELTYTATTPAHGTLSGTPPMYVYTPAANFAGEDTFTISISDGKNQIELPVTVTVGNVNDPPLAYDMQAETPRDSAVDITLDAADVDSTALTFTVVTMPEHGTLSGTAPDLVYTPEAGYNGPDSFTFDASDSSVTSNTATVTIAVTICGDENVDASEQCDDGNTVDGDGCGHSCKIEACGDGLVQFGRGEQCDDGNATDDDGCSSTCYADPFVTVAPVKISADMTCTTSVANAARKIALDSSGNVYAVMKCGTSAYVVVSNDRGASYSAPLDLSVDLPDAPVTVSQVAVASGPSGVAYVGMMLNTGLVYLRTTQNRGATWSAAAVVGTAASTSAGLSLQSFNDDVYIGFSKSGGVNVARNHNRGTGAFELTPVNMSIVFFDLLYDIVQQTLVVAADTPTFHIRASSDGGASFATEANPAGSEFYSDWAIGNGKIYCSGTSGGNAALLYVVASDALGTSTTISGLPIVTAAQTRSLAADASGNAFVASQLDAGAGVQLDRLANGATTFDTARPISATGGSPIVATLPGSQGAALVYTDGTSVYATIQVYAPVP
jgi:cysteine-rich repeat protein